MTADSEANGEHATGGAKGARGGSAVVERKPRGAKGDKASSGAAKMAERPALRGGSKGPESRKSFFDVYKRNQGTYTRVGTAVGAGVLILAGGDFLYRQLQAAFETDWALGQWLRVGIPAVVLLAMGVLLWWVVGVHRKSCDFMIATEGEMKKVSWSTKKELIGSTKVVIFFTAALAFLLFTVDLVFMVFFNWIGVLRGASVSTMLFGK